ncbi:MAG: efflux RND transporter permease subunit [Bacteroidetes bacterium]|jgi:multidrug efflux pump|nr:efflux RND transporter permease subunit [Bacteroidota bacterium]
MKDVFKEFKPSSWAIDNKTTIFIITIMLTIMGISTYNALPKELYPDITMPTVYVATIYPGSSPADMENLITKELEKEIGAISGINKIISNSVQDFSSIQVEFVSGTDIDDANQKVKDAVDKAKPNLPSDLDPTFGPNVQKVEFSDFPILQVNVSGDYDLATIKKYAEKIQDEIEELPEVSKVDIIGAPEREIQINVDMYKMQAAMLTMYDIYAAVSNENRIVSGGTIKVEDMRRSITVSGEFDNVAQIQNLTVNNANNFPIYLKDIAEIKDDFKEQESFARLDGKNVITLNVIKKSGENLIEASDNINALLVELEKKEIPSDVDVTVTGDTSTLTRTQVADLINTIIIGFILVTIVLMFFMGATDAMFVGLSVPLSMFIAFIVLSLLGISMNLIVLFAFLLGLGIVVDDAIVVIENTHRIFANGKVPIKTAAKNAAGEVFLPVLAGTMTTLAPFFPLLFWPGMIGSFMKGLPITLIITLTASLLVAYLINPVFAATFMKPHHDTDKPNRRKQGIWSAIVAGLGLLISLGGNPLLGNVMITFVAIFWFYNLVLIKAVKGFQKRGWPNIQARYASVLRWTLKHPIILFSSIIGTLILAIVMLGITKPGVEQFPTGDPNFIYTYVVMPDGTDQQTTDSVTKLVEKRIYNVLGENNPLVKSVISNVTIGANEDPFDQSSYTNKGKVGVAFIDPADRRHQTSEPYMDKFREAVKDIPGAEITVGAEQNGPPAGKPINIEISGDDFDELIQTSNDIKRYLEGLNIAGIEELKTDLQANKPEITIDLDRERMNREGISTLTVGGEIRNAVYGWEVSKFKEGNDDFPIVIRYDETQRKNIDQLKDLKITYRDMMTGQIRQIPLSAFAEIKYSTTYSGVKRIDQKRVVTLASNLLSGYESAQPAIMNEIKAALEDYDTPEGVSIGYTGASQDMEETISFMGVAWIISLFLIVIILVAQFNSISKPIIIFAEVIFSIIGVLLGYGIFGMDFSAVMTGVGVVALLGIVVRNGILLVEFTDLLIAGGMPIREAVVEAARIRMTPVVLTATATILGMIPLAIGFNIDFIGLFTQGKPDIWLGGENVVFWGPLAWTIVFGLGYATFITLLVVPVMYLYNDKFKTWVFKLLGIKREVHNHGATIPGMMDKE